ncbi:hypothetical protein BABINDRAFT_159857 [Babjeviella inositovora NRRL Y-12698]|uniref:Uncharacterized protein n=1 Tax=Babjeviella inositovora NRRL Y-12698 TaxID=984486 RepID=A0A1E3QV96_9ASCO|nr:uncharacterized protein BABINDRAFT_159857 [Babjeviella inositovora NRRL Y-12698]ODQ81585.1 hypothetical protein BABINDRAFT_159857 [Babjeviella inositovora NRRL Y-12698]
MAKGNKGKAPHDEPRQAITTDARFAGVHSDPRFKLAQKKHLKVKVDDRFTKEEMDGFKEKSKIDRYGRTINAADNDKKSAFDKYYEEAGKPDESESKSDESDESDAESSDESGPAEKFAEVESESESEAEEGTVDRARGTALSSDDDSDSSDASDSEADYESEIEIEDSKPETGDPSTTFAVVNMDWDNIRSVDLMATFSSFVPPGGVIEAVSIYPSQYGKEKMQKEDTEGPARDMFKSKKKVESDSDSDSDDDMEQAAKTLYEEDAGEDYNHKSLRRYQLQRLRYYYAVVKCNNVATAQNIYDNVDGTEYESTANIFDLRYVPEGMEFDDEARDSCSKIPANYKPNDFITDALQHSKVKLTWDETPAERVKMANRAFSQREIDEMDFKAYLASDSEESEAEDDMKTKYQNLLTKSTQIGDKNIFDKEDDAGEVDMEITFTPGLDENAETKEEVEESTIDAYRRKEKERRKRRLENMKTQKAEEVAEKKTEKNGKKGKKGKKAPEDDAAEAKRVAALELLMMGEDEEKTAEHFSMKEIEKAEKLKGKKGKKNKAKLAALESVQDNFKPELNDPRFSEIFEGQDFAIDTTKPTFKKTETMGKIMEERSKRTKGGKSAKVEKRKAEDDGELDSLVDKIKRKSRK